MDVRNKQIYRESKYFVKVSTTERMGDGRLMTKSIQVESRAGEWLRYRRSPYWWWSTVDKVCNIMSVTAGRLCQMQKG